MLVLILVIPTANDPGTGPKSLLTLNKARLDSINPETLVHPYTPRHP